jgi:hypothetical protein
MNGPINESDVIIGRSFYRDINTMMEGIAREHCGERLTPEGYVIEQTFVSEDTNCMRVSCKAKKPNDPYPQTFHFMMTTEQFEEKMKKHTRPERVNTVADIRKFETIHCSIERWLEQRYLDISAIDDDEGYVLLYNMRESPISLPREEIDELKKFIVQQYNFKFVESVIEE